MILNRDRTARLIIANQVLDGSSLGGRFEWRVDSNHEPMWLDFVATRSDGTQGVLPMIVRFVGDRKIQVRWNADFTSRPAILLIRTLRHNWCFRNSDVPQARVHVVEVLVSSAHLLSATAARAPAFENKRRYNFVSVDLSC